MRWSSTRSSARALGIIIASGILFAFAAFLVLAAAPQKHLSVYSTAANYSLPIVQRQGRDYVGLLELLEPLGSVSAKFDSRRWRLHYNNILGEFTAGESRVRIQGRDADLSAKFLFENDRGLVPIDSLSSLLPRILGGPVTLHVESDRLLIGSVGTHFTAAIAPEDSSRLVFHFTAPVNPSVSTEHGKLHMTFSREPVLAPASPTLTFDSKTITQAKFSESNGAAEIDVTTSIPLMANFSPDGQTITLEPSKAQTAAASNTAPPAPPQKLLAPSPAPPGAVPSARRYFAVVDASHGGSDSGETLSPSLAEKDVTLALARRLRQELENRGIPTLILRDSDANLSLDDRAFAANNARAAVYVAIHAASSGHGVRLYTALLPYADEEDDGPFRSWSTAQQSSLGASQAVLASVAAELKKQQVAVRGLTAPLRPLNNVAMAAFAVEVAPPGLDLSQLASPDYQLLTMSAVANGIADVRAQLGMAP